MKTTVATLSLLLVGSTTQAFAPSSQAASSMTTRLTATSELTGMIGVDLESGGKVFDPLNLAEWFPQEHMRKAELSNGRSAMLATVGWFWPKYIGTFDSSDVTTTDPLDAIFQSDNQWWAQWLLICGVIEGIKIRAEGEGKSYTGDGPAAIDWAKQWDKLTPERKESMRLSELKNGRLAMISFAGLLANELIPGACPVPF